MTNILHLEFHHEHLKGSRETLNKAEFLNFENDRWRMILKRSGKYFWRLGVACLLWFGGGAAANDHVGRPKSV